MANLFSPEGVPLPLPRPLGVSMVAAAGVTGREAGPGDIRSFFILPGTCTRSLIDFFLPLSHFFLPAFPPFLLSFLSYLSIPALSFHNFFPIPSILLPSLPFPIVLSPTFDLNLQHCKPDSYLLFLPFHTFPLLSFPLPLIVFHSKLLQYEGNQDETECLGKNPFIYIYQGYL